MRSFICRAIYLFIFLLLWLIIVSIFDFLDLFSFFSCLSLSLYPLSADFSLSFLPSFFPCSGHIPNYSSTPLYLCFVHVVGLKGYSMIFHWFFSRFILILPIYCISSIFLCAALSLKCDMFYFLVSLSFLFFNGTVWEGDLNGMRKQFGCRSFVNF